MWWNEATELTNELILARGSLVINSAMRIAENDLRFSPANFFVS